jgi:DNA-nicking Smr family endonuclease
MSSKDDERKSSFADALGGVKPLKGRDKLAPPGQPRAKPAVRSDAPRERRFVVERDGEWIWARAEDVSAARLGDLRAGRIPVDREIDLHGFRQDQALLQLREQVASARGAGARCLLVIHGRGRRSTEGAVLKQVLPEWLQADPLAQEVLAFSSAPPAQGGVGATLVWLRRTRAR